MLSVRLHWCFVLVLYHKNTVLQCYWFIRENFFFSLHLDRRNLLDIGFELRLAKSHRFANLSHYRDKEKRDPQRQREKDKCRLIAVHVSQHIPTQNYLLTALALLEAFTPKPLRIHFGCFILNYNSFSRHFSEFLRGVSAQNWNYQHQRICDVTYRILFSDGLFFETNPPPPRSHGADQNTAFVYTQ